MRHYLTDLKTAFPDFWVEVSCCMVSPFSCRRHRRSGRRFRCRRHRTRCSDRSPVCLSACLPRQVDQYATVDTNSIMVSYNGSATNLGEYHHHKVRAQPTKKQVLSKGGALRCLLPV